jgi:hypothetical protein
MPLPIDLDEAETTAIVVLVERTLVGDLAWVAYIRELVPVTFPPGLAMLCANPPATGSSGVIVTIGIVRVALYAANTPESSTNAPTHQVHLDQFVRDGDH